MYGGSISPRAYLMGFNRCSARALIRVLDAHAAMLQLHCSKQTNRPAAETRSGARQHDAAHKIQRRMEFHYAQW